MAHLRRLVLRYDVFHASLQNLARSLSLQVLEHWNYLILNALDHLVVFFLFLSRRATCTYITLRLSVSQREQLEQLFQICSQTWVLRDVGHRDVLFSLANHVKNGVFIFAYQAMQWL